VLDTVDHPRSSVGILAYGSLIADPGVEIDPLIVRRIETLTPFPVEFGRISATRGGAPTVVPHASGKGVKAAVLVLVDGVAFDEARDLLWRRETRNEGSAKTYRDSAQPNAVIVRDLPGFCDLDHVLYTDFNPEGKIAAPDAPSLADAAITSVERTAPGKDGISYLIDLRQAGVETVLTTRYVAEILSRTDTSDLESALRRLRTFVKEESLDGQS
jgi:hypothetical protein